MSMNTHSSSYISCQSNESSSTLTTESIEEHKSVTSNMSKEALSNVPSLKMDVTTSTDSIVDNDIMDIFNKLSVLDEHVIFAQNGYEKLDKICDTLQGELFKAKQISNNEYVAIKRTDKELTKQKIAIQDDISFCVEENILKESSILKYLTADNQCMGGYIIKYIDFFQSDTYYYLVMEYIESQINLKQFVYASHHYIKNGKLKITHYQKTIKYIYWQIAVTIHWLHNDMKCCHLDLCLENIMVQNCSFIQHKDGYLRINPRIFIKMGDFGVSEVFLMEQSKDSFVCRKQALSIDNELYLAPKIYSNDVYDARLADIWSLGMILYQCLTGKPLYKPMEIWQSSSISDASSDISLNGYLALHQRKLALYLKMNKLSTYFDSVSFDLLNNLLNIHENERFDAIQMLKHKWFDKYYKAYSQRIENKSIAQKQKMLKQREKMKLFPYYIN